MPSQRQQKVAKEVMKVVAIYITEHSNRRSLITITRADISPDLKNATMFVTVLPEDQEAVAVEFLNRHRNDVREKVKKTLPLKRIPYLNFEVDYGEKNRQQVDSLLRQ